MFDGKVTVILLIIWCKEIFMDNDLVRLTETIIKGAFPLCNCLYYYENDGDARIYVEEAFNYGLIPFVVLPDDLSNYTYETTCDGYVVISDDYEKIKATFQVNGTFYYKTNKIVLIFYGNFNRFDEEFYLKQTYLNGMDLMIVQGYSIDTKMIEVISIRHNKTLMMWKSNETDFPNNTIFKLDEWKPKFNLPNKTYVFKGSAFECPPFVYYDESSSKVVEGVEYRILDTISPKLPLEFTVYLKANGTSLYSQNLKDVIKDKSNVAMCSQWQISVVNWDMDMTIPYTQSCSTFLVPKPRLLPQITYVFQPFQVTLWIFCFAITAMIGILFNVSTKCYENIFTLGKEGAYKALGSSLMHAFRLFTLGSTYMPQPLLGALRQIVLISALFALLLSTAYSSGFTSSLTSPRYEKPINYLTDMVDQLIYWGTTEMDTLAVYNTTTNPYLKIINKRFKLETNVHDRWDRIMKNNYGYAINNLPNHYITETETLNDYGKTHLKVLNECVGLYYLVFGLKFNSPFKYLMDKHITRCTEHGLIEYWYGYVQGLNGSNYMSNFFTTYVSTQNAFQSLTIAKIQGIFIFLAFGHAFGIVIFVVEVLYKRTVNSQI